MAKCTVERPMRAVGLAGIGRGKTYVTTISNPKAQCPLTQTGSSLPSNAGTKFCIRSLVDKSTSLYECPTNRELSPLSD